MEKLNRIKEVLVEKDKKQKWLSEKMGKSKTSIYQFCNNKAQPRLKELKQIATILDVDIRELLVGTKDADLVYRNRQ